MFSSSSFCSGCDLESAARGGNVWCRKYGKLDLKDTLLSELSFC